MSARRRDPGSAPAPPPPGAAEHTEGTRTETVSRVYRPRGALMARLTSPVALAIYTGVLVGAGLFLLLTLRGCV